MDSIFSALRKTGLVRGPGRILGGICSAIAERTGMDVVVVRVLMVVLAVLPVLPMAVIYAIAWALLPWQDDTIPLERFLASRRQASRNGTAV